MLVLTQPDNTQYQVMRVAVACGWSHVRVLNLSDLRDPKSGSFLERVNALEDDSRGGCIVFFQRSGRGSARWDCGGVWSDIGWLGARYAIDSVS